MPPEDEAVTLTEILALQRKELTRFHSAFAAVLAGGYDFVEPMQNVLTGLERAWELLSYAFEAAFVECDGEREKNPAGWSSLETIEYLLRGCLLLEEFTLEKAIVMLQTMGVMVTESERCSSLWNRSTQKA